MKRLHLDANVVLRFLRDDDPKQSAAARRLVSEASAGKVTLVLGAVLTGVVCLVLAQSSWQKNQPSKRITRYIGR